MITFGVDNEGIVASSGRTIVSTKVFPNKDNAIKMMSGDVEVGTAYNDGRQLEFGITPVTSIRELVNSVEWMTNNISLMLMNMGLDAIWSSCEDMELDEIYSGGPSCIESGCNPDFICYDGGLPNTPITRYHMLPKVLCGSHFHIGLPNHPADIEGAIRGLDATVGLASCEFATAKDYERRKYCGRAGCYRKKSYGLEYRTVGSSLMQNMKNFAKVATALYDWIEMYNKESWPKKSKSLIKKINEGK